MSHDTRTAVQDLRRHCERFIQRYGIDPGGGAQMFITDVLTSYSEDGRHYHGLEHPSLLWDACEELRAEKPEWFAHEETALAIELSIPLHDFFYRIGIEKKPGDRSNEEISADAAPRYASLLGLPQIVGLRSKGFILATDYGKFVEPPEDFGACVLRDIDLSLLAADWDEFRRNSADIRLEYPNASEEQFRVGRQAFVRSMLKQRTIYSTAHFRNKCEDTARSNLTRSLYDQFAL